MTARNPSQLSDLADRLSGISEELADLALDQLRRAAEGGLEQAAEDGGGSGEREEALHLERRITRARRSVERAARILGPSPGD